MDAERPQRKTLLARIEELEAALQRSEEENQSLRRRLKGDSPNPWPRVGGE
jgi:hypothetical protein